MTKLSTSGSMPASTTDVDSLLNGFSDIRQNHPDVIAANLQTVKDIMAASSAADRSAAKSDDTTYATSGIAGPALGGLKAAGMPYGKADSYGYTINDSAGAQASKAKDHFQNPRPFLADKTIHNLVAASGGSLPSGHTSKGFAESLYLAYIFPERFQQILTRASEYAEHRIVLGVHYPLDIVAGRMVGEWNTARFLDPDIDASGSAAVASQSASVRGATQAAIAAAGGSAKTIAQQAASGPTDRFSDDAANKADWERRLTFGLPDVGATDQPMVVPAEAPYLLKTRFPYLSLDQIGEILRTTALSSGVAMDNGNGWARIDLYKAADGYGRLDADTTVTMDAAAASDDTRPGAGFNAADSWRNDITGTGVLIKQGSGALTLTGDDSFAGVSLAAGQMILTGNDRFSGSSQVTGGELVASGPSFAMTGDLGVGRNGTLQLGTTTVTVGGALNAQGGVELLGTVDLHLGQASTLSGAVTGAGGLIKSETGTLTLSAANTYAGGTVLSGGTLDLVQMSSAGSGGIAFAAGAQVLRLDATGTLANAITGFSAGDVIDLAGLNPSGATASYDGTVLTVGNGAGQVDRLTIAAPSGYRFDLVADTTGGGGTDLVLAATAPPSGGGGGGGGPAVSTAPSTGSDLLVSAGGSGADTIAGLGGDDTIMGGPGNDLLLGNQGDDVITAGDGANTVAGGKDDDRIAVGNGANLLYGDEGSDTVAAGNGDNTIVGGAGNGAIDSLDGADLITAGSGNDLILGNGGDDTVASGGGSDSVVGGFGRDVLLGNQGEDLLLGNQGDDTLFGGQGDDTVVGGRGNDVLYGNQGDDVLYGDEGLNTFVFAPGDTDFRPGAGTGDAIVDFASGTSRIDFASGPGGTASNFGAASTASTDFAAVQALAQTLIDGGDTYAFVADGADGYLFTTGGTGTAITDAVKLVGAGRPAAMTYGDIAHGPLQPV